MYIYRFRQSEEKNQILKLKNKLSLKETEEDDILAFLLDLLILFGPTHRGILVQNRGEGKCHHYQFAHCLAPIPFHHIKSNQIKSDLLRADENHHQLHISNMQHKQTMYIFNGFHLQLTYYI
jgi:hypothetical protein